MSQDFPIIKRLPVSDLAFERLVPVRRPTDRRESVLVLR